MYVRQAVPAALMLEREPFVVDSQQMQESGVQVVHVDGVGGNVVGKRIGRSIGRSSSHTATRHPD